MTPSNERERQRDRIVRRAALEFHDGMYGEHHKFKLCVYASVCVCFQYVLLTLCVVYHSLFT